VRKVKKCYWFFFIKQRKRLLPRDVRVSFRVLHCVPLIILRVVHLQKRNDDMYFTTIIACYLFFHILLLLMLMSVSVEDCACCSQQYIQLRSNVCAPREKLLWSNKETITCDLTSALCAMKRRDQSATKQMHLV